MNLNLAIATFSGGFIFAFLVVFCWKTLVEKFGAIGGGISAAFIVGTTWVLNHGIGMIHQSGRAWVDMAYAVGIGVLVSGIYSGKNFGKALPTVICSIIGGCLGGFILSCFLGK